jgi:xylulose-5-phosphate/fructose-6-phosphate phosphoketolase
MPGEVIDRPNPPPEPSQLPDFVDQLSISVKIEKLPEDLHNALRAFQRAASYIAAGLSNHI